LDAMAGQSHPRRVKGRGDGKKLVFRFGFRRGNHGSSEERLEKGLELRGAWHVDQWVCRRFIERPVERERPIQGGEGEKPGRGRGMVFWGSFMD